MCERVLPELTDRCLRFESGCGVVDTQPGRILIAFPAQGGSTACQRRFNLGSVVERKAGIPRFLPCLGEESNGTGAVFLVGSHKAEESKSLHVLIPVAGLDRASKRVLQRLRGSRAISERSLHAPYANERGHGFKRLSGTLKKRNTLRVDAECLGPCLPSLGDVPDPVESMGDAVWSAQSVPDRESRVSVRRRSVEIAKTGEDAADVRVCRSEQSRDTVFLGIQLLEYCDGTLLER